MLGRRRNERERGRARSRRALDPRDRAGRIPGLEVHISADVVLRTSDGPLTALSITQIPVDRPPFPLPEHRLTCIQVLGQVVSYVARVLGGVVDGDPVDLATGLLTVDKTDLVLPDSIPLDIQRQLRPGQNGTTYHTFQMSLTGDNAAYSYAELLHADGARARYTRISPGTDKESAVMEHTATPTRFFKSRVTWNATRAGWDVTFTDGTVYEFPGYGKFPYGPQLTAVRDRAGHRLTITRHPSQSLTYLVTRITSPNGRWVDVTQDTASTFVTQIRDNLGRTVSYSYDDAFRLAAVTDPAGGVTQYTYSGVGRLLTIRDPRGIVSLTNDYEANGRVIKQTQADGSFYQFAYTLDGSGRWSRRM